MGELAPPRGPVGRTGTASAAAALAVFASADLRRLARDPLLVALTAAPVALVVVVRLARPAVLGRLAAAGIATGGTDPLVAAFLFLMVLPFLYGAVIGLLLLEERDAGLLAVLRVTPASLRGYALYRCALAAGATAVAAAGALPASGLATGPWWGVLPAVALAAGTAPLPGVLMAAYARDQVQGIALLKAAGLPLFAAVAGWFVDGPWRLPLAVLPTSWPAAALWAAAAGRPAAPVVLGGAVYLAVVWWWLGRRALARL